MVFNATRIGSTALRPSQQRDTARTILLTSTGSCSPLRLVTRICVRAAGGAVSLKLGCSGALLGALIERLADSTIMFFFPLIQINGPKSLGWWGTKHTNRNAAGASRQRRAGSNSNRGFRPL